MKELCSLVIPCYNEEAAVMVFYQETSKIIKEIDELDFEFVFVDDGSADKTLDILKTLHRQDERVHYLSLSRNFGKESALYAGLNYAHGDYIVTIDVDLQDPPGLLPEMYRAVREGYDCAATRRVNRKGEPPIRSFFARLFYKIIRRISKTDIMDGARDYRFMKRIMVDAILSIKEYNRFSKGIFGWVGFRTKWIEFQNVERAAGETKWSFWKLFLYSIEGIAAFSTVPLSIASVMGIILCFVAFLMVCFIVVRALLFGDPVAGWPSMVSIIVFLGGIQLFCIGIVGYYLSKTYLETKQRPIYIVREDSF